MVAISCIHTEDIQEGLTLSRGMDRGYQSETMSFMQVLPFYLLNVAAVNNLTVCHPCRQTGPFCLLKNADTFYAKISRFVRYFLWLMIDPRPLRTLLWCYYQDSLFVLAPTLVNTHRPVHRCFAGGGEKKQKSGHSFSSITMQR